MDNKILLIEDDDVDAESIIRTLKAICKGCKVKELPGCDGCLMTDRYELNRQPNLASSLKELESTSFDLVLLDLGLPDVTKEKPLKKIRALYPSTPVVVLTGLQDKAIALESLRDGAQDFLIKGEFSKRELQRCITYAIERHRLKRDLETTAAELAQKSAILQSIINHMGDGVVVTDRTGKLTLFNPAAVNLLDATWMEMPPAEWPEAYGTFKPTSLERIEFSDLPLSAALRGVRVDDEEILVRTDTYPEGRYVSITARSILDEKSIVDGCVAVLHDITRRRKTEQMKDDFVSIVSHELRTPLTSINGSLGLILGGIAGEIPDEAREMVDVAQRNSTRLVRLINDLLDIQKLEAGKMELALELLDIEMFTKRALETNEGCAIKNNISFKYIHKETEKLLINGDEDRLLQVMANLLSNAVKYSPANGVVTIETCRSGKNKARISVSNNGPGIPKEFNDAIFGKFNQADSATTRQKEGTGLGLSICKSIISLHGGDIDFTSVIGKETTFFFNLPTHE